MVVAYDIHRNERYGAESIEEIVALAKAAYIELIRDFMGEIVLIGHSMGALICRLLLSEEEVRPNKVILLNPFLEKPPLHSSASISRFRRMVLFAKYTPECLRRKARIPMLIDPGGLLYPQSSYFLTSPIGNLFSTACLFVHKGNYPCVLLPTRKIFVIFSQTDALVATKEVLGAPGLEVFSKSINDSYHAHFESEDFREAFLKTLR